MASYAAVRELQPGDFVRRGSSWVSVKEVVDVTRGPIVIGIIFGTSKKAYWSANAIGEIRRAKKEGE
jgi:hypothetical protein